MYRHVAQTSFSVPHLRRLAALLAMAATAGHTRRSSTVSLGNPLRAAALCRRSRCSARKVTCDLAAADVGDQGTAGAKHSDGSWVVTWCACEATARRGAGCHTVPPEGLSHNVSAQRRHPE